MKNWMQRIQNKLRSRAGESISETMISVLVAALALVMLAGAVSAGSGSIAKSRKKLEEYYAANELVTMRTGTAREGELSFQLADAAPVTMDLDCFVNNTYSNRPVIAYKQSP